MTLKGSASLTSVTPSDNVPQKAEGWHLKMDANGNVFVLTQFDAKLVILNTNPVAVSHTVDLSTFGSGAGNPVRIAVNPAGGVLVEHFVPAGSAYEVVSVSGTRTPLSVTADHFASGLLVSQYGKTIYFCGMGSCPLGMDQ
jgi:hypothetical protein